MRDDCTVIPSSGAASSAARYSSHLEVRVRVRLRVRVRVRVRLGVRLRDRVRGTRPTARAARRCRGTPRGRRAPQTRRATAPSGCRGTGARCVEAVWCVRNGFGCSASPTAASNASVISSQT
eukprot:scaffold33711_cov43-Phaeocystis_antarctica.AAC.2